MKENYVVLKNVFIDKDEYDINSFIKLKTTSITGTLLYIKSNKDYPYESNIVLFFRALQLALPTVSLKVGKHPNINDSIYEILNSMCSSLLNYYPVRDNNIILDKSSISINLETTEHIKRVFEVICHYNQKTKEDRDTGEWVPDRWQFSYQQYLSACAATSIESSVLNLISGLESLLVKGEGLLSYKVALYSSIILSDNIEIRKEINKKIKYMYNLRSKVVHGEVNNVVKIMSKPDIYERYFELKKVLSDLLIITYGMNENDLFERIEEVIFQSPKF